MRWIAHASTDMGLLRPINEDSFYLDAEKGLFIVADGLGGLQGGEIASKLAISSFVEDFSLHEQKYPERFEEILWKTTHIVYNRSKSMGFDYGMGTTFTAGLIREDVLHIAHIGDSVAACRRGDQFLLLTEEHTEAATVEDSLRPGEDALIYDELEHSLTSCIGQNEDLAIQSVSFRLQAGDRLLFCTDGLTKTARYPEISQKLFSKPTPKGVVAKLLAIANSRGGPDNTTVIVVFVEE